MKKPCLTAQLLITTESNVIATRETILEVSVTGILRFLFKLVISKSFRDKLYATIRNEKVLQKQRKMQALSECFHPMLLEKFLRKKGIKGVKVEVALMLSNNKTIAEVTYYMGISPKCAAKYMRLLKKRLEVNSDEELLIVLKGRKQFFIPKE